MLGDLGEFRTPRADEEPPFHFLRFAAPGLHQVEGPESRWNGRKTGDELFRPGFRRGGGVGSGEKTQ